MKFASIALLLLAAPPVAEAHSLRGILHFLGLDHENDAAAVSNDNNKNHQHRRLEDFLEQAEDGKATDALETLEENGDGEDVSIVDNEVEEEAEDMDMEDEEEAIEEELVEDEGYTEEEIYLARRQFVSYTPSPWEQQWAGQIEDIMNAKSFCRTLLGNDEQVAKLRDYMEMFCVAGFDSWCFYSDYSSHYMWFNKDNMTDFELYVDYTPEFLRASETPDPDSLVIEDGTWDHIASKFTYHDEFTDEDYDEYLEPLVSHLRFPLAECLAGQPLYLADYAGFVAPPKYLDRTDGRRIFYDVGSTDWSRMQYVTEQWKLQGIEFEFIASYAPTGTKEGEDVFVDTVPEEYASKTYRNYFTLTDAAAPDGVSNPDNPDAFFLPTKIINQTVVNDYVVVKLDRGVPAIYKDAILDYILAAPTIHIDELIVELNPMDMYVMQRYYDETLQLEDLSSRSMGDVYRTLGALRAKGIRAHAWI